MRNNIVATGLSGMVGTRIQEMLSDQFDFQDISFATGIDITNYDQLKEFFTPFGSETVILHLAAKTDVNACEDDKILGEEGGAWQVNVVGTENLASLAKKKGINMIYISTDFVFDGTKEHFSEEDTPNPVNWYGNTKYEGELVVQDYLPDAAIVRIAYPYRAYFPLKKDFVRRIIEKLDKGEKLIGIKDHIMTPTFVDDIALAIKTLLVRQASGIYHVVGSQSVSSYDAIKIIADNFGYRPNIKAVNREEYFKDQAFRPFKLALKNDKIKKLGVVMKGFEEGLACVKDQLKNIP